LERDGAALLSTVNYRLHTDQKPDSVLSRPLAKYQTIKNFPRQTHKTHAK
jgi:hypothetical protein